MTRDKAERAAYLINAINQLEVDIRDVRHRLQHIDIKGLSNSVRIEILTAFDNETNKLHSWLQDELKNL